MLCAIFTDRIGATLAIVSKWVYKEVMKERTFRVWVLVLLSLTVLLSGCAFIVAGSAQQVSANAEFSAKQADSDTQSVCKALEALGQFVEKNPPATYVSCSD